MYNITVGVRVESMFVGKLQAGSSRMRLRNNTNFVFRQNPDILLPLVMDFHTKLYLEKNIPPSDIHCAACEKYLLNQENWIYRYFLKSTK